MNYIIGDIHSNINELKNLLRIIKPRKEDKLIFIGDYVDKNIYFEETIKFLISLIKKYRCILIKGNHDFVWDRYLNFKELFRQDFLLNYGGVETLRQFTDK
ncbi:metallophosphoesterase, partial [bacterium]|nr:metallophosphoesterase [bacterium]